MTTKTKLNRADLLNAAAALAEETGLKNLTLGRLAGRLGIKTPSLYNHIRGLGDLLGALAELGLERLGDALAQAAIGRSGEDAMRAVSAAFRRFAKQNPELYKAVMDLPRLGSGRYPPAADHIVDILERVLEPYGFETGERMHVIRTFKSAIHGFISLESAGFFKAKYDIEESFDRMISMIITGMTARA
jgi:AcrR family transcriptional regulator